MLIAPRIGGIVELLQHVTGRLNQDRLARRDLAFAFRRFNHRQADAVFDAAQRIGAFELGHDPGLTPFRHAV